MNLFVSLSRIQKQIVAVAADALFLPLTFCLAVWLRHDVFNTQVLILYADVILATPIISTLIFIRLGLYRAVIRFINYKIINTVFWGVSLSVLLLVALAAFTSHMSGMSRTVFAIYWLVAILYVAASRLIARNYLLRNRQTLQGVPVIIYGAGAAGNQLAAVLGTEREYFPVAFVDDKKELQGATIRGIKVYPPDQLKGLVDTKGVAKVLLAMPSIAKHQQKRILDELEILRIGTLVTPAIKSLINGDARVQDIREVEIEDLLGRDAVEPDMTLMAKCIASKVVLVSGAGGSIGSELCRQIFRQKPTRLVLLEMSEFALYSIEQELVALKNSLGSDVEVIPFLGSVLEQEKCASILKTFSVDTVYHAAAYKHVPLVEHNPIDGVRNNVFGTLSIARAAMAARVRNFVLISTDKAVRPTNVMGATKRLAELILQALASKQCQQFPDCEPDTNFSMVRFGNVLGSSGSVVPLFRKQILAGGPITLTHPDITRYFMTIPEAAQLVLQAGAMSEGGDVFVLDMGSPVKIADLAKRMVHLSGLEVKTPETPNGSIELQHVGLRPGEKLYEELLIGNNVERTSHPLIMRAKELELAWSELNEILEKIHLACTSFDHVALRFLLQTAVGEYSPQCGIEDLVWKEFQRHVAVDTSVAELNEELHIPVEGPCPVL